MDIQTAPKLLTSRLIVDTEINPFHQLYSLEPSDVVRIGDMPEFMLQGPSGYVKAKELAVPDRYLGGSIRVKWMAKYSGSNARVRVYVDGVAVGEEIVVPYMNRYSDMSDEIAIEGPGMVQLYAMVQSGQVFVKDFTLCADDVIIAAAKGAAW